MGTDEQVSGFWMPLRLRIGGWDVMDHEYHSLTVIGLGYIGLPTAAIFAARKLQVLGVDINESAVEMISQGKVHIVEPELDMVVHAAVTEGFLRVATKPEPGRVPDRSPDPVSRGRCAGYELR